MTSTFGFRRVLRPPILTTFGVATVLALTACGSEGDGGVASANGGKGANSSTPANGKQGNADDQLLKFAKCMRDKGVEVRDPKPGDKGVLIKDRTKDPAKAKKAWGDCELHLPEGFGNPRKDPKFKDQALKFAQCMRANGVDMPDPGPDGSPRFGKGTDPESPETKRAEEKCKQFRPNGWGG